MPITPPTPEEKGRRLEEELKEFDEEFMKDNDNILAHLTLDLCHERDAIHSKHYARIEGEKNEAVTRLKEVMEWIDNWEPQSPKLDDSGEWEETEREAKALIAKHTTSQPQGK